MNDHETPVTSEDMAQPDGMWTPPTSQGLRPRPATIHEGFTFPFGEDFGSLTPWDSSALPLQHTAGDAMSRPESVHSVQHHDLFSANTMDLGMIASLQCRDEANFELGWSQKPYEDGFDFQAFDADMSIGQAFTADEAVPVLDLRHNEPAQERETLNLLEGGVNPRRMSGSSFTMSTSGALSDIPSYEDFSAAMSDAPSFSTDYPPPSNRNSLMSSTQLSPVASPRMTPQSRTELVRTQSRGRASPSPRPGVRSAPYNVDGSRNSKRWSTGTYGTNSQRRPSPFVYQPTHDPFNSHQHVASIASYPRNSSPTAQQSQAPLNFHNLQAAQQHPFLVPGPSPYQGNNLFFTPQIPSQGFQPEPQHFEQPPPLMSHGLFRMLSSNADPHALHGHYTDLSDPPDLFAALHEEQIPPPPEDLNPSDPDLVPHEQELRFEGDLYTPRWVRGHGNKREGWCGICKPGRWLVLKNSAFWYDKSFTHGISAATGNPFQEPQETRRMDGNPDVWEGLCGSCNDWIALVSSKKKGTTWFRHAYKVHRPSPIRSKD